MSFLLNGVHLKMFGKIVDTTEQLLYYNYNQIIKRCEKMSNYSLTSPESGDWCEPVQLVMVKMVLKRFTVVSRLMSDRAG